MRQQEEDMLDEQDELAMEMELEQQLATASKGSSAPAASGPTDAEEHGNSSMVSSQSVQAVEVAA